MTVAETEHDKAEEKSKDELNEINEGVLYNKGCIQRMAQILLGSSDPEVTERHSTALEEPMRLPIGALTS